MYAPLNSIQEREEASSRKENASKSNVSSEISLSRPQEEKLASPLPAERANNPLPQRTRSKCSKILPINKEVRDTRGKPPVHSARVNNTRCQINYNNVYWEGNDTSYLQIPNTKQPVLEQFSINDTTDIRLCHRCGGEGHITKYCNVNVQCDFCKSYSHHTSVCRSYANFVWAHPMASSRRTSPVQFNKQVGWPHPLVEEDPRTTALHNNDETCSKYEVGRRREISDITWKHLEQIISAMIPSSTGSSIDPVESAPVNSMVTQQSCREPEEMSFKLTAKENEKHTIINNYYVSDKESGWKQLQKGEILPNMSGNYTQKAFSEISTDKSQNETQMDQKLNVSQDVRTGPKTTIEEAKQYYSEKGEVQNMSPSQH